MNLLAKEVQSRLQSVTAKSVRHLALLVHLQAMVAQVVLVVVAVVLADTSRMVAMAGSVAAVAVTKHLISRVTVVAALI
jgi:hypothetical protein